MSSYCGAIEILVCVLSSDVTNSSFLSSFFQVPTEHIFMINFPPRYIYFVNGIFITFPCIKENSLVNI